MGLEPRPRAHQHCDSVAHGEYYDISRQSRRVLTRGPGPGPSTAQYRQSRPAPARPAAPYAKPRPPAGPSVAAAKYRLSRRALSRRQGQETAQYRRSRRALPESLPVTTFPRHGATGPEMARFRAAQAANLSLTGSPPWAARQGHHNVAATIQSRCSRQDTV